MILGGGGNDTVTIDALDSAFNAGLEVYGTGAIDLAPKTDPLAHLSFKAQSAAGEALFGAEGLSVTVAGQVDLGAGELRRGRADTSPSSRNASLTTTGTDPVLAEDIQTDPGDDRARRRTGSASISIGDNATVSGGERLADRLLVGRRLARAAARRVPEDIAGGIGGGALALLNMFFGSAPISVIVKSATVSVTVGQNATVAATNGSLQIIANASVASNGSLRTASSSPSATARRTRPRPSTCRRART